jgi:hypothetical protein
VYELQRNALKGLHVREDVGAVLEELPILCIVCDTFSMDRVQRAAHLEWGNGLSMADALMLQALLDEDASHILTTESPRGERALRAGGGARTAAAPTRPPPMTSTGQSTVPSSETTWRLRARS